MPETREFLANCRITIEDLYTAHKWQFEFLDHSPHTVARDLHRFVRGYLRRDAQPEKEPQQIFPGSGVRTIEATAQPCKEGAH